MKLNENQKITLTIGQLKKLVKESEDDKNENRSYVVYYRLFDEKDKVLYLSARSSKDAIFSAIDTIKVRNHLKTRDDVFEILQSIEVKKTITQV